MMPDYSDLHVRVPSLPTEKVLEEVTDRSEPPKPIPFSLTLRNVELCNKSDKKAGQTKKNIIHCSLTKDRKAVILKLSDTGSSILDPKWIINVDEIFEDEFDTRYIFLTSIQLTYRNNDLPNEPKVSDLKKKGTM